MSLFRRIFTSKQEEKKVSAFVSELDNFRRQSDHMFNSFTDDVLLTRHPKGTTVEEYIRILHAVGISYTRDEKTRLLRFKHTIKLPAGAFAEWRPINVDMTVAYDKDGVLNNQLFRGEEYNGNVISLFDFFRSYSGWINKIPGQSVDQLYEDGGELWSPDCVRSIKLYKPNERWLVVIRYL